MRVSVRPLRFDNPVYEVPSRRVILKPFEGQPKVFKNVTRMPSGEIKESTQMGAGYGYFVTEDVREGQAITLYAKNEIPEWLAAILSKKVRAHYNIQYLSVCQSFIFLNCLNLCRAIDTFVTIMTHAAVWTPSQPQCEGMIITVACIKLLDSSTQLLSATQSL
jgi:hypothetical protein